MALYGRMIIVKETPIETKFGINDYSGMPPGIRFDQVRLPKLYTIPPQMMSWNIVTLTRSVPGTGLFILLNREYFWLQYMSAIPEIAKKEIMG